jgi:hypothetical protein
VKVPNQRGCQSSADRRLQFWDKIKETGLRPGKLWGKNIYRRSDLQAIIERTAWPKAASSAGPQLQ